MDMFNTQEIFKYNKKIFFTTLDININIDKIKPPKIIMPKLKTLECYKADEYYIDLYSKVPHHSHR
jgi:hypothetical protein